MKNSQLLTLIYENQHIRVFVYNNFYADENKGLEQSLHK